MKTMIGLITVVGLSWFVACSDDENDESSSTASKSASTASSSGSGATGGASAGGSGGTSSGGQGGAAPCVASEADCVACGADTCGSTCCTDLTTATCEATCTLDYSASCDGAEDCPGMDCCVEIGLNMNVPDSGTATCGTCTISGSTAAARSVACRVQSDCGGVVNQFGVPYSECCWVDGYDVGICVSQTSASVDFGDNCNN